MKIIMGTGSRSMVTAPDAREIYGRLEQYLMGWHNLEVGGIHLISGMAEGWDEAIAKVGMRNGVPYDCYVPTRDYGNFYWARNSRMGVNRLAMFDELLSGARAVHYLEDKYGEPTFMKAREGVIPGPNYNVNGYWIHANMLRNQEMVDISDMAVVYEATSSGTRDAVARLRQAKLAIRYYPFKDSKF